MLTFDGASDFSLLYQFVPSAFWFSSWRYYHLFFPTVLPLTPILNLQMTRVGSVQKGLFISTSFLCLYPISYKLSHVQHRFQHSLLCLTVSAVTLAWCLYLLQLCSSSDCELWWAGLSPTLCKCQAQQGLDFCLGLLSSPSNKEIVTAEAAVSLQSPKDGRHCKCYLLLPRTESPKL